MKSLAGEFGITHKSAVRNPTASLGLNPNLNIEDQYVENLLKQVHFLGMEIKLIKEKQKDNKGLGIMGLLNKDTEPVVQHAITSNAKFSQMKSNLGGRVNSAEAQFLRLDDENYAVKAQRDHIEKKTLKEEQRNIQHKIYVDKEMTETIMKVREAQKRLQEAREEADKVNNTFTKVSKDWEDLTTKERTRGLLSSISGKLEAETQELRRTQYQATKNKLTKNETKLKQADEAFHTDPEYVRLVQQNQQLKDRIKRTDRQLFDMGYHVKEMEELKKLALRNKDSESQLKKQTTDQADKLKKRLADRRADMEVRLKDSKQQLDADESIRMMKGKLARRDKQISELKKKTQLSENNYKRLRDQVSKLTAHIEAKKASNAILLKQLNHETAKCAQSQSQLQNAQLDYQKTEGTLQSAEQLLNESKKRLEELEEQLAYLVAKEDYLKQTVDVDEGIKKVKIEQLAALMHSNSGLNSTITDLMGRWDQILRFSKEPPQ